MRKITFATYLGAGYLLGARDGRARYEQIVRARQGVKASPAVQEAVGVVQAQAVQLFSAAKSKVSSQLSPGPGGATHEAPAAEELPDYSAGSNGLMR